MMKQFPILETERLILSQLKDEDIPCVVSYLQDKIFSDLTTNIPYPYGKENAEFWIKISKEAFENNQGYTFAIRNKDEKIMGAIGIHDEGFDKAEMGYWLAKPFWNTGYVTEAAKAVIHFCFTELKYNKIFAIHLPQNSASGVVMQKAGMQKEAVLKQHIKKDGIYLDVSLYSIFRNGF